MTHWNQKVCSLAVTLVAAIHGFAPSAYPSVEPGNFTAASPEFLAVAEQTRRHSARFWSGQDLPGRWSRPCPIHIVYADHSGGGATSFNFDRGEVSGWSMRLTGRRPELLADVLPHEVDHMVRASLIRRPIPRWLDEGCATLMESPDSHAQLRRNLRQHLHTPIDARFLDCADYPSSNFELDRLYTVGFSLVEFLLTRDSPRKLLAFQTDPRAPSQKLTDFYDLTISQLDTAWRNWAAARTRSDVTCTTTACIRHCPCHSHPPRRSNAPDRDPRPRLTLCTSHWCGPCRRFYADYRTNSAFRTSIDRHFQLLTIDIDRHPEEARRRKIDVVPTFFAGSIRITGYEGPDWLLARLGIREEIPTPNPSNADNVPPQQTTQPPTHTPSAADEGRPQATDPAGSPALDRHTSADSPNTRDASDLAGRAIDTATRIVPRVIPWLEIIGIAGGSAATGGAGALAFAAFLGFLKRRRTRRANHARSTSATPPAPMGGPAERPAPFPRRLDEARQLLQLRQSEGRVAVLDALRGMFLDDEFHKLTKTTSVSEANLLNQLRTAIDHRVNQVAPLSITIDE